MCGSASNGRITVVELARIADVRECCGERYLLVEHERGSLVRRWFTRECDPEQRPLVACPRCSTPLLPPLCDAVARARLKALPSDGS
jgi:hypothetical protein